MIDTSKVKRITFRMLVLAIFVSLIFDFLWLVLSDMSSEVDDGGVEKGIKQFVLKVSYISFFFRVST
jgi:hypothetical protein